MRTHVPSPAPPVRPCLTALLCAGLIACGGEAPPPPSGAEAVSPTPPSTWAYTCPDGRRFVVHYRDDEATVELAERQLGVPRVSATSGDRYQSGDTLFWDRGGMALLDIGDEWYRSCRGERAESPGDAARLLDFDFRGLGQEPGWLVDVDLDRQVRWVGQYGTVRFATPAPDVVEQTDGASVWSASTAEHELTLRVVDEPCEDAMSGQAFTHTVTAEVDGEELRGCGGWLGEGTEPGVGPG
jgi:uncharacterized membrane protein/membrane-bound inhibitor of C-type lysozyme